MMGFLRRSTRPVFAIGIALSVALLAACGTTTQFTPTNPPPRAMTAKAPEMVHVFTSSQPEVPYVEVGIIQSRQSSEFSVDDMPQVIQAMRTEAGKIGCDGVIINGASNETRGNVNRNGGSVHTLEGYWGACIVYR